MSGRWCGRSHNWRHSDEAKGGNAANEPRTHDPPDGTRTSLGRIDTALTVLE
jgi:hypothetical protein